MKLWKPFVLPLVCLLSAAAAACGNKEPGARSSHGEERVGKFKLGHAFDKDGEATQEVRTFAKGEKVCVSFTILDPNRDAQARVLWVTKPGVKIAEGQASPEARESSTSPPIRRPGPALTRSKPGSSNPGPTAFVGSAADFTVTDSSMK